MARAYNNIGNLKNSDGQESEEYFYKACLLYTSKDDIIANLYVKEAVLKYHCVVSCVCGIHLDDITNEEMQAIIEWVKEDILKL